MAGEAPAGGSNFAVGGMYMQLGSAVSGMVGSYFSSQVSKINLQGQAELADSNARIAELGAQSALLQGQQQVAQITLRAGHLKSSQRASMAANGIDLGEGSAVELQASTDIMKEIDANTAHANAVRSAWGLRTQATNFQNESIVKRSTASTISPMAAAGSSLMGSAGSVASNWYAGNKSGAFNGSVFEMSK